MASIATTESWEQFFSPELERLRRFYTIELNQEDFREIEGWLQDRFEVRSTDLALKTMKKLSETEIKRLRYDFVQFVKRNRRIKNIQAHGKVPAIGATNPLGESEERDRRIQ